MSLRAVMFGVGHKIQNVWVPSEGNWFNYNGRSYRKDRRAICKVVEKDGHLKGIVEAIYIEGNPIPLRSNLKPEDVTLEHLDELIAYSTNKPKKKLKLFGR